MALSRECQRACRLGLGPSWRVVRVSQPKVARVRDRARERATDQDCDLCDRYRALEAGAQLSILPLGPAWGIAFGKAEKAGASINGGAGSSEILCERGCGT